MIIRKLKEHAGETLIETLAALLICCLAMAALTSIMTGAGNMMNGSGEKLEAYYAQNGLLSSPGDEEGGEGSVVITVSGTPLKLNPGDPSTGIPVEYYENLMAGEAHPVTAYYMR